MSHQKLRKETDCLNCNAEVNGRYCSVCGQENAEPQESAWHFFTHFFQDITHFEGKFFRTLRLIFTKPGLLADEYLRGRRASYMNPVRLYVFSSFLFFLLAFTFFGDGSAGLNFDIDSERISKLDSVEFSKMTKEASGKFMTPGEFELYKDSLDKADFQSIEKYQSVAEYDSLVKIGKVRANWLERLMMRQSIKVSMSYKKKGDSKRFINDFTKYFVHSFPQMLFISLPLFALGLCWLYARHKKWYYVSHGVFTIYLFVFLFAIIFVLLIFIKIGNHVHSSWPTYIIALLCTGIFLYEYLAMRNFYKQSRGKTLLKMFLINSWLLFVILILFIFFSIIIFFKL